MAVEAPAVGCCEVTFVTRLRATGLIFLRVVVVVVVVVDLAVVVVVTVAATNTTTTTTAETGVRFHVLAILLHVPAAKAAEVAFETQAAL